MKTETAREIAEKVINEHLYFLGGREKVTDSIEAALNAERERCAKIAEERAAFNARLRDNYRAEHQHRFADLKDTRREEAETIANEIREKENED